MYLVAYQRVTVGALPSMVFGGALEVVPTEPVGVWLHTLLSLPPPVFVGSLQVQLPFSVSGPGEMV
jgi:hypothetical protein